MRVRDVQNKVKTLFNFDPPATDCEVNASALKEDRRVKPRQFGQERRSGSVTRLDRS